MISIPFGYLVFIMSIYMIKIIFQVSNLKMSMILCHHRNLLNYYNIHIIFTVILIIYLEKGHFNQ
jgi:hypothetical protein